jgi:membrane protein implicated in regulation of membrane protease activity
MLGFCNVWALLLATSLGGVIYSLSGSFHLVAALAAVFSLVSILILRGIAEPRGESGRI